MENREIKPRWYVLRAASGKENKVKEYIEQEMNNPRSPLHTQVFQAIIPTEKVYTIVNGKRVEKERAYLPGYVLIESALTHEIVGYLREFIPNCLGFLGYKPGELPEPIRPIEIKRLLGLSDSDDAPAFMPADPFKPGDTVKVIDDSLQGFSGVVDEVYDDKKKLKVIVTIFGRKTPVELGFNQVVKD